MKLFLFSLLNCLLCLLTATAWAQNIAYVNPSDPYQVALSNLDGSHQKIVFTDPNRQVNSAHVSPDGRSVVFVRFNNFVGGKALEVNGYTNTEIIKCSIEGRHCRTIIPNQPTDINANPEWLSDSTRFVFIKQHGAQIPQIDSFNIRTNTLATFYSVRVPVGDPYVVGNQMVVTTPVTGTSNLYMVNLTTRAMTRLTSFSQSGCGKVICGDFDPKLTKDAKRVVFMRHFNTGFFHTIVATVPGDVETDLSVDPAADGLPVWSPDAQSILFWNALADTIVTMLPTGRNRSVVPLGIQTYMDPDWVSSTRII